MVKPPLLRHPDGGKDAPRALAAKADIVIGLINIMPPGALKSTENMFRRLLSASAQNRYIHLRLFTSNIAAGGSNATSAVPQHYENLDRLWSPQAGDLPVDGLIVTGTEPRAAAMEDEPCWPLLQKLCDWAAENTISTIWSCFAAHAAALHIDGIQRRRREEKLSGIFECRKAGDHFVLQNLPAQWSVPHSRFNGLDEAGLQASNYRILSHTPGIGVDSFAKRHKNSEFIFFQGHPEYEAQTLFGEYHRDCKRFVSGESTRDPKMPENYFDFDTIAAIETARASDTRAPDGAFPPEFVKSVIAKLAGRWRAPSQQIFGAWLSFIAEQKTHNEANSHAYNSRSAATG